MTVSPDAVNGAFVPVPKPTVSAVELEGETVLLEQNSGAMHLLNPIGTAVWASLDGTSTIDEIAIQLSEEASADRDTVQRDVVNFVQELVRAGLLGGS